MRSRSSTRTHADWRPSSRAWTVPERWSLDSPLPRGCNADQFHRVGTAPEPIPYPGPRRETWRGGGGRQARREKRTQTCPSAASTSTRCTTCAALAPLRSLCGRSLYKYSAARADDAVGASSATVDVHCCPRPCRLLRECRKSTSTPCNFTARSPAARAGLVTSGNAGDVPQLPVGQAPESPLAPGRRARAAARNAPW